MRRALGWLGTGIVLAILAGWFAFLRPAALGGPVEYVVVRGTSMLPALETGDLLIVRAQERYAVGAVVAYRVPQGEVGEGLVVIHRLSGVTSDGRWIVRGDNNSAVDPWMPANSDIAGGAWIHVPMAGRLLAAVHQPAMLGAIAAALVVMMMLSGRPAPPAGGQSVSRSATKTRTRPVRPEEAASSRSAS